MAYAFAGTDEQWIDEIAEGELSFANESPKRIGSPKPSHPHGRERHESIVK
jgi:hypothetical protein